jgi:hypothetical protein
MPNFAEEGMSLDNIINARRCSSRPHALLQPTLYLPTGRFAVRNAKVVSKHQFGPSSFAYWRLAHRHHLLPIFLNEINLIWSLLLG